MTEGRTYGGESAADRGARRRRQLLDAGLEIVGTQGFRAATVRGVCREARVADRNFYEEFASTEDLLLAVYDECTGRLRDAAAAAVQVQGPDDLPALARAGIDAFLRVIEDDPRLGRLVWLEVIGVSPRVSQTYLERMEEFGAFLLALLPDGPANVGEEALALIVRAAVGGVNHVVLAWVLSGLAQPRDHVADALMRFLVAVASAT